MTETVVEIRNLTFYHSRDKKGLKDLSLSLEQGKVYGLWGRNGAGKTTLMKLMTGLLKPQHGSITLFGEEPFENRRALGKICFIQENHPLNPAWRIRDVMKVAAYFYPAWDPEMAESSLRAFSLDPGKKVKTLSKGMRTAVALTVGLASKAPFTIFDEPTNGLDAAVREIFYNLLISELEEGERTVMLSTHFIQELQAYIEDMVVLHDGELILHEPIESIRERAVYVTGRKKELEEVISHPEALEVKTLGSSASVLVEKTGEPWQLAQKQDITMETPSLQDYLLRKTDRKKEGVWS
ncbi:ABC transporter ATP-binding protein [Alteribacter natronophilus]|uniref:ABC transporter ATP-binding protein n=1 Tax=Alteribacter natronophilus TaxID=2583810 RepID=UPI00110F447F|nr:ABC transporter ATP-binding protein [Alteribacter natronophilus]TMW71055.1 ABC transporter ATP-binding protein [Alteribacter natronophilus]